MQLIENLSIIRLEDYLDDPREWDIYLSCVSFEERCIKSSKILSDKNNDIGCSIIFNYKEIDDYGLKMRHLEEMKENLNQISNSIHVFNSESVSSPSEGVKKFLKFINENHIDMANKKIVVDISVLTKPYFFLLIKVMNEKFGIGQFHVIYSEPAEYNFTDSKTDRFILTLGLDRIESIPGYIGSNVNSSDALIVILGFEGKRAIEVFQNLNPSICYSINGFPSFRPGWHRISLEENLRFFEDSGAFDHLFFAPAIDPFETMNVIHRIVQEIKETAPSLDIAVAPLGTKMQAFGVLLYALKNKFLRVVYPFPSRYDINYSSGCGISWIFKVNLESLVSNSDSNGPD